jgi:RimJ/RimL family protein N-acetyltransferase
MTPRNTLIYGQDARVAAWVAAQIPHVGAAGFGPCRAVAVACGDRPLGAIVYHDYDEKHGVCQISMAAVSPMWAKRQTILDLLAIPFRQYRCRKVWTCIPSDNMRAIRFNYGIGMVREAVLRHHFGHKRAAWVFGMMVGEYDALCERWAPAMKEAA